MYPVRQSAETYGRTEEIIGNWLAARGSRDNVVVATKVIGPGGFPYIRGGRTRHNREHIEAAVETSLKRLQTDYIDLYQLHWPDRATNTFGKLAFEPDPDEAMTPLAETLEALDAVVKAGKVRQVGLSNENPWGAMTYLQLAEAGHGPRMASVQNAYSLLNRSFETRMAEVAIREDCGLLAYAPVAAGNLTGKYLDGKSRRAPALPSGRTTRAIRASRGSPRPGPMSSLPGATTLTRRRWPSPLSSGGPS